MNDYNFTIPVDGGLIIDNIDDANGLFGGYCVWMVQADNFDCSTDSQVSLGDAFLYSFAAGFELAAPSSNGGNTISLALNQNAPSGAGLEVTNLPVPPTPTPTPDDDSSNLGLILGLVFGGLALLIIILLIIWYVRKKSQSKDALDRN